MPNTLDWMPNQKVRALVFGRYKSGKTFGALTFPTPNVMDFDRGIATARNPEFVKRWGIRKIQYDQFVDQFGPGGIPKTHDGFDAACKYFDTWMTPAKRNDFETWIVDSGTTLSSSALNKAIILMGSKMMDQKSATLDDAKKTGLVIPRMQDYGAERSMMEQFVRMLLDSDKHVVLICHEKEITDDKGTVLQTVPLLTGQSVERIPIMFDEVWHVNTRPSGMDRVYELQTQPIGTLKIGSRYGVPDGTPWNWEAVDKALSTIRAEQLKQADEARKVAK